MNLRFKCCKWTHANPSLWCLSFISVILAAEILFCLLQTLYSWCSFAVEWKYFMGDMVCNLEVMFLKLQRSQLEEGRQCRKAVVEHPKIFCLEKYKTKLLLDRIKISRFIPMQKVALCGDSFLCFRGIIYL